MNRFISLLSSVLFTTFVFLPYQLINAQSPNEMSYQAVFRNIDDDLVKNSSIGKKEYILQGSTNRNVVSDVADPVANQNAVIITSVDELEVKVNALENIIMEAVLYTLKDIDGNSYTVVKIGNQEWLVENLKVTKYNDGTSIANVTNDTTWSSLSTGAYCWFSNNEAIYKSTYGTLYNWHAVSAGNLCPTGWHVPTDAEWATLIAYLGGETIADGKLKEAGTTHWIKPNTEATNESGFTALPGGFRCYCGAFFDFIIGYNGNWWSSTEYDTLDAWSLSLYGNYSIVTRSNNNKSTGFSVRCVRD